MKREPRRTCLGCRRVRPKRALVRLVRGRDGVVVADPLGVTPGRGAYVCPDASCLERALGRARLGHAFRNPCEASEALATGVRTSGVRGTAVRAAAARPGEPVTEALPSEATGENASEEVRGLWRQR